MAGTVDKVNMKKKENSAWRRLLGIEDCDSVWETYYLIVGAFVLPFIVFFLSILFCGVLRLESGLLTLLLVLIGVICAVILTHHLSEGETKERREVNKLLDFLIDGNFKWKHSKNQYCTFSNFEEEFTLEIPYIEDFHCYFRIGKVWGIEVVKEDEIPPRKDLIQLDIQSSFYEGSIDNADYPKIDILFEKIAGYESSKEPKKNNKVENLSVLNSWLSRYH